MTSHPGAVWLRVQLWLFSLATRISVRAAWVEGAARRWFKRAGDLAQYGRLVTASVFKLR